MPGYTPRIKSPGKNSIADLIKLNFGNSEQWILIRSENTDNSILLYVHGGPGTSELSLNRKDTQPLEKHFIVVNWDQRGAGKSYQAIKDKSRMNVEQFVSDIHELSEYLGKRFNKEKIILVGHSWGSSIGMLAVSRRPDLYSAYIGIGQTSNNLESEKISYQWTLEQAQKANDQASIKQLTEMGAFPYSGNWQKKFMTQRQILGKFGGEYHNSKIGAFGAVMKSWLFSPEYTFMDRINFFRGIFESVALLFPEYLKINLFEQVPEVNVPVWFMLGRYDYEVPSILAEQYFNALIAPSKTLHWFENSAHLPNNEERDLFNQILVEECL